MTCAQTCRHNRSPLRNLLLLLVIQVILFVVLAGCEQPAPAPRDAPAPNRPPEFASGTDRSREVAENTAAGTVIGRAFRATDADGDAVSYALAGTDAAAFALGSKSGVLATKAALDYETRKSYAVTVRASDEHGKAAALAVTVAVTNVDEAGAVTFDATAPVVGTALRARVTDPDGSVSGVTWQWAKASAKTGTYADIAGATAAAYTPAAGDAGQWLRATASYTDGHGAGKSAAGVADAAVMPGPPPPENRPPVFAADTDTSREVAENTPPRRAVGRAFRATDADGAAVSYALAGADAAAFTLGSKSGVLATKAALDYETRKSYAVTVRASDEHGKAADLAVTVGVTNVDEPGSVSFDPETPEVGRALTARVTDPDGGVSGATYRWAKAATQAGPYADIAGATAAAYTPAAGDAGQWLRATASYTDGHGGGKSAAGVAYAGVAARPTTPAVNKAPVFAEGTDRSREVAENTAPGTVIGKAFRATDADGDEVSYALAGADASAFTLGSKNGCWRRRQRSITRPGRATR